MVAPAELRRLFDDVSAPTEPKTTLEGAIDHIADEPTIWVRLAAMRREDGSWQARLLELTSGAAPPGWTPMRWDYPSVHLASFIEAGDVVAPWITARAVIHDGNRVALPQLMNLPLWDRRQSRWQGGYQPLDWPATETTLGHFDPSQGEFQGHLVSKADAPSFVNLYTGAVRFFYLGQPPVNGSLNQGMVYRHQDLRGRLRNVRIAAEAVEVKVDGDDLEGMIIELAGDAPGVARVLGHRGGHSVRTTRFRLKSGLSPGAWVLLRRGDEWIDRRFLTQPWARGVEAGVEFAVEARTRLEAFLAEREGPEVEFKELVPKDDSAKARTMKTVCAFANGQGGSVLFGIDDDGNLNGIAARDIDRVKDQLTQMVGSWVEPQPGIAFETLPIDDRDVVVLEMHVEAGVGLYGCHQRLGDTRSVFIRHMAITVKARPAEIETIVRSRMPAAASRAFAVFN